MANLLGVVGVIGSLVFVGLELQQSQQIALGGQQQARTALIAELWLAGLQGESETLTAMQSEWETLTLNREHTVLPLASLGIQSAQSIVCYLSDNVIRRE